MRVGGLLPFTPWAALLPRTGSWSSKHSPLSQVETWLGCSYQLTLKTTVPGAFCKYKPKLVWVSLFQGDACQDYSPFRATFSCNTYVRDLCSIFIVINYIYIYNKCVSIKMFLVKFCWQMLRITVSLKFLQWAAIKRCAQSGLSTVSLMFSHYF